MGSWPGADADAWWASLPPERREQIRRWMNPGGRVDPVPEEQLELDVPIGAGR